MERIGQEKEVLDLRRRTGSHRGRGLGVWLVVLATCCLASCTTLKKAGITSLATGAGATVATALSSGAAAPILGGMTGAFVGDVATEVMIKGSSKGVNMDSCAPDNFWSLLGQLVETGGWLLLLIIIVPMIFSWLMPGPVKFKGKNK